MHVVVSIYAASDAARAGLAEAAKRAILAATTGVNYLHCYVLPFVDKTDDAAPVWVEIMVARGRVMFADRLREEVLMAVGQVLHQPVDGVVLATSTP